MEFRKDKDHRVNEDVGVNVKENYVLYHLKDDDSEVWVINDFNRVSNAYFIHSSFNLIRYNCMRPVRVSVPLNVCAIIIFLIYC